MFRGFTMTQLHRCLAAVMTHYALPLKLIYSRDVPS